MQASNEMAHRGMGQVQKKVSGRDVNYSNYSPESPKLNAIKSKYHDPEDANYEIYELIIEETGNELFASKILDRDDRHKLAVKLWADHGVVRNDRFWESQERRLIRNFAGNAVVDNLQTRRKTNNRIHNAKFSEAHRLQNDAEFHLLIDEAYKQWEEEERGIQNEFDRLSVEALAVRVNSMSDSKTVHAESPSGKPQYAPPFKLPTTIDANRNTTLFKRACSGFSKGDSPESVWAVLEIENRSKCYEPLSERELRELFKSAEKKHLRHEEMKSTGVRLRFTDTANGDRIIEDHSDRIRFIQAFKNWVHYADTRWLFEAPGGLFPLVRLTIEGLYQYAVNVLEGNERSAALKEITTLESITKQKAMIEMASKVPAIIIQPDSLDRDLFLLNVHNGTLDLRTGILREHRPEDFITKQVPVFFDPSAKCPVWLSFLVRIMNGNQHLIEFLQRAIGYSLTGDTSEQCLFFLYGTGANGKSTLLNIIRILLADYAACAAPDILMAKDRQGGATPELARLPGVRFLATSETEDNQRFAEAALKQMTGQDTITARFLYGEFFEFKPQFKIWFATNHKPIIKGDDNAIWRGIDLIPFNVTIPLEEQDRDLEKKLIAELPGILNWAVAGCMEWQKKGLQPPEEVKAAVNEYRKDMDIFSQWLDECCVQIPSVVTLQRHLYASYKEWSEDNIGWSISQQKFGRVLVERGFSRVLKPQAAYRGVGLAY